MPKQMQALVLNRGGDIDNLELTTTAVPYVGDFDLLVKTHATGLNPSDYQTIEYLKGDQPSLILGLDVAGEVVAVGKQVSDFKVGDRVMFLRELSNPHGGFAEYSLTPAKWAIHLPAGVSYQAAATLPGAGMTAYHVMEQRFHLRAHRQILIQAGAGNVGYFATQLAKLHHLTVTTTALKDDFAYCLSNGAHTVIDYQHDNVWQHVDALTAGHGFDYVVSSIGSKAATKDLKALATNGELACLQGLPDFASWQFYKRGITVHEIMFGGLVTSTSQSDHQEVLAAGKGLAKLVASGQVTPPKTTKIQLRQVPTYLSRMKQGRVTGKVIVDFEPQK